MLLLLLLLLLVIELSLYGWCEVLPSTALVALVALAMGEDMAMDNFFPESNFFFFPPKKRKFTQILTFFI